MGGDSARGNWINNQYLRMGRPLAEVLRAGVPLRVSPSSFSWFWVSIFWKDSRLLMRLRLGRDWGTSWRPKRRLRRSSFSSIGCLRGCCASLS